MVLKRLLVTALGALGLGALAAGTALAQSPQNPGDSNIPAPDLFDDQITCINNVPAAMNRLTTTVVPMGAMESPLDTAIGMGDVKLDSDNTNIGTVLTNIGYVIPAAGSNCGAGTDMSAFTDTGDNNQGSIATDVAEGYSDLYTKYTAVYGDPSMADSTGAKGALDKAQKDLAMAPATNTDAQNKTLQDAVDSAQEAYNDAKAAFDAVSAGPVYQAGVAEWMAQAAVIDAVDDYNTKVDNANMAKTTLDAMDYGNYVPLINTELISAVTTISDGMATIGTATQLRDYANADGDQVATVDSMTGVTTSTDSNFDANGDLVIPQVDDPSSTVDGETIDLVNTSINGVDEIRTRAENFKLAADALKKRRDENKNPLLQDLYDEVYRRAKIESDYASGQLADTLADTTDQRSTEQKDPDNDQYVASPITISGRNAKYVDESNKRAASEADLRAKAAAREAATESTAGAFQSPTDFYNQLVARRQALKFAADKKVADASKDGATPSKQLTSAAEDAAKALTAAETAQANVAKLLGDTDNPTVALVNTLLEIDGDDGQALADAISSNYAATKKVADSVDGLVGDDGAVGQNTAAIAENAEDITALDGRVTQNEADILTNAGHIMENRGMIETNTANIATNAGNIMTNTTNIATNAADIMENRGMIDTNTSAIGMNTSAIADNANAIGSNSAAIQRNSGMIGELSESLETVRAGVAASMALAGMPAINGRGISIGVGSFDGESAFAVGFMIQSEMASFKVGVTSAGGATGASAGVGFQF